LDSVPLPKGLLGSLPAVTEEQWPCFARVQE